MDINKYNTKKRTKEQTMVNIFSIKKVLEALNEDHPIRGKKSHARVYNDV